MAKIRNIALINKNYREINPLDVGEQECEAGHSYGPAIRKYTLIHHVFSGKGTLFREDGQYPVNAGEAFIIRPGEVTTYTADLEKPWHYIWIGFDGTLSAAFAELPPVIASPGSVFNDLRTVFDFSGTAEAFLAGKLFELYAHIFSGKDPHENYLLKISNYVETNYNDRCDVGDIAAALNLERHYLARMFRQKTGITLKAYITQKRMDEAKQLLAVGHTVAYSAQMVGYSDAFIFSKMFKKHFGVSPSEWKRENAVLS